MGQRRRRLSLGPTPRLEGWGRGVLQHPGLTRWGIRAWLPWRPGCRGDGTVVLQVQGHGGPRGRGEGALHARVTATRVLPHDAAWGHVPCGQVGPCQSQPQPQLGGLVYPRGWWSWARPSQTFLHTPSAHARRGSGLADPFPPGVFPPEIGGIELDFCVSPSPSPEPPQSASFTRKRRCR